MLCQCVYIVRHHYNRYALPCQPFQKFQKHLPRHRIQSGKRLIQHQKLRLCRQNACDRHSALLSAGQRKRRLIFDLLIGKSHLLQGPLNPFLLLQSSKSAVFQSKAHILFHGLCKKLIFRILKNHSDFSAQNCPIKSSGKNIFPVQQNFSALHFQQSSHRL